ncbi:MAG: hypothetical protein HQL87_00670 [Magnetococcales bacterium]|nr:hypothetical protein [Magnetococcales bacterium]
MSLHFPNAFSWTVRLALLGVLGGCAVSGPAVQDPVVTTQELAAPARDFAQFPPWQLGSTWEYSDGYTLQVTETDGRTATLKRTDRSSDWFKREGFFKMDSQEEGVRRQVVYQSPNPATLFPLAMGKTVSFAREYLIDKKLYVHQTSWSVVGRETIEVPAGKFDCWVLVWNTRSQKSNWSGYEKWWYSPEVGNYVRLEYRYGKAPDSSRVLMRYKKGE